MKQSSQWVSQRKLAKPGLHVQNIPTQGAQEELKDKTPCDVENIDDGEEAQQEQCKANVEGPGFKSFAGSSLDEAHKSSTWAWQQWQLTKTIQERNQCMWLVMI